MKQFTLILFISFITGFSFGKNASREELCLQIQDAYFKEAFDLTKNAVGFSAPVSARAYAYLALGMYEASKCYAAPKIDFTKRLNDYTPFSGKIDPNQAPAVLLETCQQLSSYLYRSMPPSNAEKLRKLYLSLYGICKKTLSRKELSNGLALGKQLAQHVISYSKTDGADEAFLNNYPTSYKETLCLSCWTRTSPGYFSALQPYWGKNRYFIASNKTIKENMEAPIYSTDSSSQLFKDALQIDSITHSSNTEYEVIAEYWDDAPGYSGTPSGHLFNVSQMLARNALYNFQDRSAYYLALGIAINDAFIACWDAKYTFNFLRPITYIHRHINPQFNSRIASPSFPEYPSGHSMQSGAGSEIMNHFIGREVAFTDSTNNWRKDIDGKPRSFGSFDEMAKEISNSRVYGGIHYQTTANQSLKYGKQIGLNTIQVLTQMDQ